MTRVDEKHQVARAPVPHDRCHVVRVEKPVDEAALNSSSVAVLAISGMGCPNCALRVRNGLLRQTGVVRTHVSFAKRHAWVNFDPGTLSVQDLKDAVAESGLETEHNYEAAVIDIIP